MNTFQTGDYLSIHIPGTMNGKPVTFIRRGYLESFDDFVIVLLISPKMTTYFPQRLISFITKSTS